MTYCVAMCLEQGLLFGADTRTNAGVDHISTFRKLYTFQQAKSHAIVLLCSGNLATSQSLIELLRRDLSEQKEHILSQQSLFDVARLIGQKLYSIIQEVSHDDKTSAPNFSGNILLGGQIKGESPRLFQVYPQGNFIEATRETPYLQIGEHKYGKPILDRVVRFATPLTLALNSMIVSLDSTIKSNLSVGLPMDILVYEKDSFDLTRQRRFTEYDEDYLKMRQYWNSGVNQLLEQFPTPKV
ncbi:hypothetical protein [Halioxenophilus sp. WMMB6]|uniref:hypothetical protein n=1 Tax=Halioxenophilus sp. WMMB6 TaxID=3073815 RepID=UPI00295EC9E3|nr:hypothetical protein [Halioxenophilus sp. WMMB6]